MSTEPVANPKSDVAGAVERASRAVSAPISLHAYTDGAESGAIVSCGGCAACRFVQGTPWGRQACRRSREHHVAIAARRSTVTPFLCHMGFSCVTATLESKIANTAFDCEAIVAGPFLPEGPIAALEPGIRGALADLQVHVGDSLPFTLEDIPVRPAEAIVACVTWLFETLDTNVACANSETIDDPQQRVTRSFGHKPRPSTQRGPYLGNDIALALAGGNQDQARALVRAELGDTDAGATKLNDARRARTVGLAGAVLEAAERAGLDTASAWEKLPGLIATVRDEEVDPALAVMRVIGSLKKRHREDSPQEDGFAVLNAMLAEHLADKLTLNDAAAQIGLTPSGLTRRLERKFGMTYTAYYGRLRVDKGKAMLRDTELDIHEIGLRLGIQDASNFAKLFRKFEGLSPTDYRAKHRKK